VQIRRRRFAKAGGAGAGTEPAIDDLIDVVGAGVSLAAREMCCRVAVDSGSFARAASNLDRLAGLKLSDQTLRTVAESQGRAVLAWQEHEQLELDFDAGKWLTDQTGDGLGGDGPATSRAYVGIDGFMLPAVTDTEAGKRFDKAVARRKRLKRRRGVRRGKLVRRGGADNRYKEMKLVTMYNQDKDQRLVRATRHGMGKGASKASRMLRQMSQDVHLKRAKQIVAVTDGAEWIANLVSDNLPKETTVILDWYHASQHVHTARRAMYGEFDPNGAAWAEGLLKTMTTGPFEALWQTLLETRSKLRSPAKRKASDELMHYLVKRREKIDYPAFKAGGFDIGSGPTESMCKSLSRRMKGIGMRWKPSNAESMVALETLHQSELWRAYWSSRLAA
jgi:hypothetical protein